MSEQTENRMLLIIIFLLYGVVGGMEMREQQEIEQAQYAAQKPKPQKEIPQTKCKIRTKTDSCIVRLA